METGFSASHTVAGAQSVGQGTHTQPEHHVNYKGLWATVVWNDSVNLPNYVTHVLAQHFGFSLQHAKELAAEIEEKGRAIVAKGIRERVEADVSALHSFGVHATMEMAHTP